MTQGDSETQSEPVILDVAGMTDEEIVATAETLDAWFQEQRRRYLVRPSTELGPDGLSDEQIAEMAHVMNVALWEEHERIGPASPEVSADDRPGDEGRHNDQAPSI